MRKEFEERHDNIGSSFIKKTKRWYEIIKAHLNNHHVSYEEIFPMIHLKEYVTLFRKFPKIETT
jgi:hypothetical protein